MEITLMKNMSGIYDDYLKINNVIKNIFRVDSYYSARTFKILNSNVYYQSIFQLHLDSVVILASNFEPKEIATIFEQHFETVLNYMSSYKEYSYNSPESQVERIIETSWNRREFISIMKEFYSSETPVSIVHFIGQMFVSKIPDIKISSWKFGKYPAHYHDKTRLWAMLTHRTNLVEYWNQFQEFVKLLEKHYPDGISKQGTHRIPKKKDITKMVLLNAYIPDLWLDLARLSKNEEDIITYLRIALCLDQTRYDIWKELIKLDPTYPNTNIPQLDDEINAIINRRVAQADKETEEEKQQLLAKQVVNKVQTLTKRQDAFNEMAQMMRQEEPAKATTPITTSTPSAATLTDIPSYFEYMRGIPGINPFELFKKVDRAIKALPNKNLEAIRSLEMVAQHALNTSKLDAALDTLLSITHISAQINAFKNQIIAMSNLGIYFSNARRYDVARLYATEAKNIATRNNLLEEKLQALKVIGLIHTNENKNHRERITILEETAETLRQLGREEERQQILAQIKTFKEFLDLLGK